MRICPKCGTILKDNEEMCPKCNTKIVLEDVEVLDLPLTKDKKNSKKIKVNKTKKETIEKEDKPKKIKKVEATSREKTIKKDNIPLVVKKGKKINTTKEEKIEEPKKTKKEKIVIEDYQEDLDKQEIIFNIKSSIKIIIVLILLTVSIILIINISNELDNNNNVAQIEEYNRNNGLFSDYTTQDNEIISIKEDKTFIIIKNKENKDNNYYEGTYEYKQGIEAIEEMGYTENDIKLEFGEIDINKIYSLTMKPTKLIENKKDVSNKKIKNNETWNFYIIEKNDQKIIGYNKTLDKRYNLSKEQ